MSNTSSGPWFSVSLALMGLIVGYGIAAGTNASLGATVADKGAAVEAEPVDDTIVTGPIDPVDVKKDHIRGNPNAKVAIIEYSDFECPFCKMIHPTMNSVLKKYGDDVMLVYRHYPLPFHQNAAKAAEGSECVAAEVGNDAFWKYHDYIFDKGQDNGLSVAELTNAAKAAGMDEAKFKECLDSGKFAQVVKDQMNAGSETGVNGTPGNIVMNIKTGDAKMVSGAQPEGNFAKHIDALLKM